MMLVMNRMMQCTNTICNATWIQQNNKGIIRNDNNDSDDNDDDNDDSDDDDNDDDDDDKDDDNKDDDDDSGHADRGRRPVLHLRDGAGDPVNPRSWVHSQVRICHLIQLPPTEAKLTNFTLAPVFTFTDLL